MAYIENPEKMLSSSGVDMRGLFKALGYATNSNKAEQRLFVTGVNCLPEKDVRFIAIKDDVDSENRSQNNDFTVVLNLFNRVLA